MNRVMIATCAALIFALAPLEISAEEWALKGDVAETCCCQAACPCVFNSAPTLGHCEGSTLFEIEEGNFGDVDVDGLNVVMTYRFGEWLRLYIDEHATDEQAAAVVNVLNQDTTFGSFFAGDAKLLSAEQTKVSVEKSKSRIRFSVPDSKVDMEVMEGQDGKPIRIENLTVPYFLNGYTQYTARTTSHQRGGTEFSYSGTNGATSHVDARGNTDAE